MFHARHMVGPWTCPPFPVASLWFAQILVHTRANQMRVTPISILMRGGGSLLLNCARTQRAVKSIPKNDLCRMDDAPPRQQARAVWRETHAGPWAQRHSCVPGQTEGQRAFYRRKIGGRRTKDAPG